MPEPIKILVGSLGYSQYIAIPASQPEDRETASNKNEAIIACLENAGLIEIIDLDATKRKKQAAEARTGE